jgi:hypothetical protein
MLYLKAIERVESKKARLNLTREQLVQLKERRDTEKTVVESAMRALYPAVWLPAMQEDHLGLEKVEAGGRPLQATGIHQRLMELLTLVPPPRLFDHLTPTRIVELMRLGEAPSEGQPPRQGVRTRDVCDAFFGSLGFPRLTGVEALQRAITQGVREGVFGYVGQAHRVRDAEGQYQVKREHVALERILTTDEINLDDGFLVLPDAIEVPAPPPAPVEPTEVAPQPDQPVPPEPGDDIAPPPQPTRLAPNSVQLSMRLNRQQIYQSFNAISNLAEKAGTIRMTVEAETAEGFDPVWLRNAVLEPLEEADVETDVIEVS